MEQRDLCTLLTTSRLLRGKCIACLPIPPYACDLGRPLSTRSHGDSPSNEVSAFSGDK
jgi:hypothetical protein